MSVAFLGLQCDMMLVAASIGSEGLILLNVLRPLFCALTLG